jgi:hypothetical protein
MRNSDQRCPRHFMSGTVLARHKAVSLGGHLAMENDWLFLTKAAFPPKLSTVREPDVAG